MADLPLPRRGEGWVRGAEFTTLIRMNRCAARQAAPRPDAPRDRDLWTVFGAGSGSVLVSPAPTCTHLSVRQRPRFPWVATLGSTRSAGRFAA